MGKKKIEPMSKLVKKVGLVRENLILLKHSDLICDSEGEIPFQLIKDFEGDVIHDSRINGAVEYECFEKIKRPLDADEFQIFYRMRNDYFKAYWNYLKNKSL